MFITMHNEAVHAILKIANLSEGLLLVTLYEAKDRKNEQIDLYFYKDLEKCALVAHALKKWRKLSPSTNSKMSKNSFIILVCHMV